MPVIGLVGGVGSGKSTVARELARLRNVRIIDADGLGHIALRDQHIQQLLRDEFGEEIFAADGSICRPALAARVFKTGEDGRAAKRRLEEITHPVITREMQRQLADFEGQNPEAVVLDAALLLEAGWDQQCDAVVFVETPQPQREKRVLQGRGWSPDELARREDSQVSLTDKKERADFTINNADLPLAAANQLALIVDELNRQLHP